MRAGGDVSSYDDFQHLPWLPGYTATIANHTFQETIRRDPGVSFAENELQFPPRGSVENVDLADLVVNDTAAVERRWMMDQFSDSAWNLRVVSANTRLPTPVQDGDHGSPPFRMELSG